MEQTDLYALFTFTNIYVSGAREDALRGRKHEARDLLRFVRNARILAILKANLDQDTFRCDVAHLEWKVRQLEIECHPSTPNNPAFMVRRYENDQRNNSPATQPNGVR